MERDGSNDGRESLLNRAAPVGRGNRKRFFATVYETFLEKVRALEIVWPALRALYERASLREERSFAGYEDEIVSDSAIVTHQP